MTSGSTNDLLLLCLRAGDLRQKAARLEKFSPADWETLLRQAGEHGLIPLLAWYLNALSEDVDIPKSVRGKLYKSTVQSASRNLLLYHELGKVLQALRRADVLVIGLKGVHLAESIYEDIALRPMGDVDLMVKKHDLARASEVLIQQGYLPSRRFRPDVEVKKHYHLPPFYKPKALVVEIHWNMARPTGPLQIDVDGLWDRAQPVTLAGVPVLALCPEDLLLILCIHLCRNDFRLGLKPLCDVAASLAYYGQGVDWEQVTSRAVEWCAGKCVYLTLYLVQRLLGAPVPEQVLVQLRPDDFSSQINDSARERVLSAAEPAPINPYLLRLWGVGPLKGKLILLRDSVFPPPEAVAQRYSLPPGSKRIYLYYLVRLVDLLRLNGRLIWGVLRRDPISVAAVQRENALNDWWMST